jgi:hypothetical protein
MVKGLRQQLKEMEESGELKQYQPLTVESFTKTIQDDCDRVTKIKKSMVKQRKQITQISKNLDVQISIVPLEEYGEKIQEVDYDDNLETFIGTDGKQHTMLEAAKDQQKQQDEFLAKVFFNDPDEKIVVTEKEARNFVNTIFPVEKIETRLKELESEKRISKNCFKGDLITSSDRIMELANLKRSVYHTGCWKLRPAKAIMQMQFEQVVTAVWKKELFEVINTTKDE